MWNIFKRVARQPYEKVHNKVKDVHTALTNDMSIEIKGVAEGQANVRITTSRHIYSIYGARTIRITGKHPKVVFASVQDWTEVKKEKPV